MSSLQPEPAAGPPPAPAPPRPPTNSSAPGLDTLLNRPADQRRREYQYRFAQSVVFGLPVFALELFGRALGGPEADRWVAILQCLLAGWVLYVAAAGMLFEGVLRLRHRRLSGDFLAAAAAVASYGFTLARLGIYAVNAHPEPSTSGPGPLFPALWFDLSVGLLIGWTGLRWWYTSQSAGPSARNEKSRRGSRRDF